MYHLKPDLPLQPKICSFPHLENSPSYFYPLPPASHSPTRVGGFDPLTTYQYLKNAVVGESNKFLLKKSVTETHCNKIVNHWTSKIYEI